MAHPYVLILFISLNPPSGATTPLPVSQPSVTVVDNFKSQKACNAAAADLTQGLQQNYPWLHVGAYCLEKK